jgi:hypothetical protein
MSTSNWLARTLQQASASTVSLYVLMIPVGLSLAADEPVRAPLSTTEVVGNLVRLNESRTEALRSYISTRTYDLEYRGLGYKRANMVVRMTYHWPDRKEFTILSEGGSKVLRDHVLRRLLEAEQEAANGELRERTAIHPRNYDFQLLNYFETPRDYYVLEAKPKIRDKCLFQGQIWVDPRDFAIVRIEGEPAKNPSWWTKHNQILHTYQKLGDFWLPARNETRSQLRIAGHAVLTIEYTSYQLIERQAVQPMAGKEKGLSASGLEKH